jgi:hypothetical protein
MYVFVLFLHIVGAILSIGPFFLLVPLLKKIRLAEDETLLHSYIDLFRSASRLTKHAGHVLVIAGVLLMFMGGWSWGTSWILATIVVMVGSLSFIARAFTPILKKLRLPDHNRDELVRKLTGALWAYIVLMLVMMWLMVAKPVLW